MKACYGCLRYKSSTHPTRHNWCMLLPEEAPSWRDIPDPGVRPEWCPGYRGGYWGALPEPDEGATRALQHPVVLELERAAEQLTKVSQGHLEAKIMLRKYFAEYAVHLQVGPAKSVAIRTMPLEAVRCTFDAEPWPVLLVGTDTLLCHDLHVFREALAAELQRVRPKLAWLLALAVRS